METIHTDKEGKLAIFGNTKQVIQDYHTAFDNSLEIFFHPGIGRSRNVLYSLNFSSKQTRRSTSKDVEILSRRSPRRPT